jgi:hypothetical protein
MGESVRVNSRTIEVAFLAIMALAVLVGGKSLLVQIAAFKGLAVSVLVIIGIFIIYAFRQNYRPSKPEARLAATRDAAFLATIGVAVAFIVGPPSWWRALGGAAVVGFEIGIVVEILARFAPPPGAAGDRPGTDRP